jgi:hypothetical protein
VTDSRMATYGSINLSRKMGSASIQIALQSSRVHSSQCGLDTNGIRRPAARLSLLAPLTRRTWSKAWCKADRVRGLCTSLHQGTLPIIPRLWSNAQPICIALSIFLPVYQTGRQPASVPISGCKGGK